VIAALLPLVALPTAGAATTWPYVVAPGDHTVVIAHPINGWVQAITGYPAPRPAFLCDTPGYTCSNITWPFPFIPEGVTALDTAISDASSGPNADPIIVFAYSQGTQVAEQWLVQHKDDATAPSAADLSFILLGNSTRAFGGSLNVFGGFGDVWPASKYDVIDIAREYEYSADLPNNPSSPYYGLALINAIMGGYYLHDYASVADLNVINDPANTVWKVGNITYVLVPTENLPLLDPLRQFGLAALADQLNGPLKAQIDQAYNRNYPGLINDPPVQDTTTNLVTASALSTSDISNPTVVPQDKTVQLRLAPAPVATADTQDATAALTAPAPTQDEGQQAAPTEDAPPVQSTTTTKMDGPRLNVVKPNSVLLKGSNGTADTNGATDARNQVKTAVTNIRTAVKNFVGGTRSAVSGDNHTSSTDSTSSDGDSE
jgi:pimeloyl-ACP methyl ester carboxylesterase